MGCYHIALYRLKKVSHRFRYKILSLPPGQLDIQPSPHSPGTTTQLSGARSTTELIARPVSNQNTQQALALPEKEVIQPHLPVRLPCYDFTPVTSPAFGIPLLAVKLTTAMHHLCPRSRRHPSLSRGFAACQALVRFFALHRIKPHAPPLVRAPVNSFEFHSCERTPQAGYLMHALRPIIPDNACILCLTAAAGTELADAYSPDTVIASSPGKEVHDPSLGRVSVPVWLIILSDQLLIIALVLTRYSPVRHWKHHFPSDLHVLSMPPAFILSQDRTLHEIHSCITYSFLVRRQSGLGIVFHSKA
ncbi:hypothetical protein RND81_O198400 [Saponaria officinalis]|uniref:Uncharacterized protein n=1 Tax=Saponaria officinalis TaxID=3572 RepID=A0AAW1G9D7_SAPOF